MFLSTRSDNWTTRARSLTFSSISDAKLALTSESGPSSPSPWVDEGPKRNFWFADVGYAFPITTPWHELTPSQVVRAGSAESESKFGRFEGETTAWLQRIAGVDRRN